MTVLSQAPGHGEPARLTGLPEGPPRTLADEHVLLLRQITSRARDVLAAATDGQWPAAELASLAGYARAELLRQAAEEEALLFPASPPPITARLARDHVRLRAVTDLLTRAAAGEQNLSPGQLAVATRDFVDQLEYHLSAEEKLLASGQAPRSVPAIASLAGGQLATSGPSAHAGA